MTSVPQDYDSQEGSDIAVIGMAGRFPGADSVSAYWRNLRNGKESITQLDDQHLREQGVSERDLADPEYVKVGGLLEGHDRFDAALFGYSPRDAELLDPQQRVFLECVWEALETAGYDTQRYKRPVGVYAGAGMNGYLLNLYSNPKVRAGASPYELFVGNDKDFLTSRAAYKLDLLGPSVTVQTACSSSLVAVHMACQALLGGDCDMAVAGGVAITQQVGYRRQTGGIYSHDGHCRAFDAAASGTVGGNGVGVVVLKRLEDAIADGDSVDAAIKGSAINNDGAQKVSFTAPQVDSQAAVIRNALAVSGVTADTISLVEAHGTGTALGDPIEIAALTQAYRSQTDRNQFCRIGSVKTNIGHLDAAAGIAGLMKCVLALKHREIPASLHFEHPNPQIDFATTPFEVNRELTPWNSSGAPRRAAVSSFGIGGTNAHVVLEEATWGCRTGRGATPAKRLAFPLSAANEQTLDELARRLAEHVESDLEADVAAISYTLQEGRRELPQRRVVVASTREELLNGLKTSRAGTPDWETVARWVEGKSIDWAAIRPLSMKPRRVVLPTYPFDRKRYWIDSVEPTAASSVETDGVSAPQSVEEGLYYPSWRRLPPLPNRAIPLRSRWLLFLEESDPAGAMLAERIEAAGHDVYVVVPGERFAQAGFRRFTLDQGDAESYDRLFEDLKNRDTTPDQVVNCWGRHAGNTSDTVAMTLSLRHVALLAPRSAAIDARLTCVTAAVYEVLMAGAQAGRRPPVAALLAVARQENPRLCCRAIDVGTDAALEPSFKAFWRELNHDTADLSIALRGEARWKLEYDLLPPAIEGPSPLDAVESLLIVGDLSSEVGRAWLDQASRLDGKEVNVVNTNPAIEVAGQTASVGKELTETLENLGERAKKPLGVFVCGPTTNEKSAAPMSMLNQSHWGYNHASKIAVFQTVAEWLDETALESLFVCVQSSLSSVLGGVGLAAYAATNEWLDQRVAARGRRGDTTWSCIGWDRVRSGEAAAGTLAALQDDEEALSPDEVWRATLAVLRAGLPGHHVVSRSPLHARIERHVEPIAAADRDDAAAEPLHTRPDLDVVYVAPRNEIERRVAAIWETMLGVDGIGVDDDFFALGGHSLLAIQIIAELREAFGVEVEMRRLIGDSPTVAHVASAIAEALPQEDQLEEAAKLLAEIEGMSAAEVQSQLE